jgi:putative acetyltransferase
MALRQRSIRRPARIRDIQADEFAETAAMRRKVRTHSASRLAYGVGMELRPYRDEDCGATRAVFERAVRLTASGDYSPEQVEAWAPSDFGSSDLADWGVERAAALTVVAAEGDELLGFSDLVDGRLIDMLYVDPAASRRGIATALLTEIVSLARAAGASEIETYASLTARPTFERHGFAVIEQNTVYVRGVSMTNFRMRRPLP